MKIDPAKTTIQMIVECPACEGTGGTVFYERPGTEKDNRETLEELGWITRKE